MKKFLSSWEALIFHACCSLKTEFVRYRLHFIWWFVEPLFMLGTMYLVFGIFLMPSQPNFVLFLMTGLALWQWFAATVPHAANSIHCSMKAFQQYKVHPLHFPLCVFLQDLAKYIPVFLVFLAVTAYFTPCPPSLLWLEIIPVLLVEGLCVVGCAILVSSLVPFLPDLAVVVNIMIQILFLASGIFYDIEQMVLPQHRLWLYLNPNAVCIKALRDITLKGASPDWGLLGLAALISLSLLVAGLAVVSRSRKVYPRLIEQ